MASYMGALDQGTSSTRFMVFDTAGKVVATHQQEFAQIYPQAGWAEHDPQVILNSCTACIEGVVEKMKAGGLDHLSIKSIGITNQRETTVVWDRNTGLPLHNAIVWLDTRTKSLVEELVARTPSKDRMHFSKICGLPFSTYFSAVKLRWLLDNVHAVKHANLEDRLMVGTIDSWLIYKLTGGKPGGVHVTDVSNASRTMLMNLKTLQWDDEVCSFFDIKKTCLPEIRSSAEVYGHVESGPLKGVPIAGCLGDQQAALVGHCCFEKGMMKNTYGTGCFMLCNTGDEPVESTHGLLTTVGYQLGPDATPAYALEGSIAVAGAAVKWLRDNMGIIKEAKQISEYAAKVGDTGGVYFVPAFSGLFAPYWRDDARGGIFGMTQYTTKNHLCRATLEQVCYQTRDVSSADLDYGCNDCG
jgi:glycerol kinase